LSAATITAYALTATSVCFESPGWKLEEAGARGWFRSTTPSGRKYLSGPTIYPI
jgi:hypothetical protein